MVVACEGCGLKMRVGDGHLGHRFKCAECGKHFGVPSWIEKTRDDPSLSPPVVLRGTDAAVEHLRVIRLYVGWLLVIATLPLVLMGIAVAVWLIRLIQAAAAS